MLSALEVNEKWNLKVSRKGKDEDEERENQGRNLQKILKTWQTYNISLKIEFLCFFNNVQYQARTKTGEAKVEMTNPPIFPGIPLHDN